MHNKTKKLVQTQNQQNYKDSKWFKRTVNFFATGKRVLSIVGWFFIAWWGRGTPLSVIAIAVAAWLSVLALQEKP